GLGPNLITAGGQQGKLIIAFLVGRCRVFFVGFLVVSNDLHTRHGRPTGVVHDSNYRSTTDLGKRQGGCKNYEKQPRECRAREDWRRNLHGSLLSDWAGIRDSAAPDQTQLWTLVSISSST